MTEKVSLGKTGQFEAGRLTKVDVNGTSVVVTVIGDSLCAVRNKCTHFSVPLDEGDIEDGAIVCPNHGSRFDMCSGEVRDWVPSAEEVNMPGFMRRMLVKKPKNVQAYTITVEGDEAFIEL